MNNILTKVRIIYFNPLTKHRFSNNTYVSPFCNECKFRKSFNNKHGWQPLKAHKIDKGVLYSNRTSFDIPFFFHPLMV